MSYATKQDMIDRFGEEEILAITDIANPPAGVIDDDRLTKALDDADAEINSYIATRITTPVTPVSRQLVNLACAIARYRLSDPARDRIRTDYEDARTFLRAVGAGSASLGDNATSAEGADVGSPLVCEGEKLFDREAMRGFR